MADPSRAVRLLQQKQAALGRLPQRTDFTEEEVVCIKATLGPWPRALEAAGLKAAKIRRRRKPHPRRSRAAPARED